MFCTKCGKEINDEAVICPYCGCPTSESAAAAVSNTSAPTIAADEKPGLATGALVCAFLFPVLGLILGIVGTVKYKTSSLKNKCIAAIPISIVVWIISAIIMYSTMY